MNRTPPHPIRRALRSEVGFGCPIEDCANPYLEWHHFDPPWCEREHHNPGGMIALCAEHHSKADAGAFTTEQLRSYKNSARRQPVQGRFDWMRNKLLAAVGSGFYYETLTILRFRGRDVIWFRREAEGNLLLNVQMPTRIGAPGLIIEDNDWIAHGALEDLECPPSGRLVQAKYPDGDYLRIEFSTLDNAADLAERFPDLQTNRWAGRVSFPITLVQVYATVAGMNIQLTPRTTMIGNITIGTAFMAYCGVALTVG